MNPTSFILEDSYSDDSDFSNTKQIFDVVTKPNTIYYNPIRFDLNV